jgi:nucleotide-binding universal stress UspA family protein
VVIALDRSDLSARALPFAKQVAQLWRGRLVLVHALLSLDEHAPVPVELELRSIVQDLNALGITADAVVRHASPAQAIVDVVREREADLIVMASHQRHGLNRWLRGSITEDVLARTRAPLVMIPGEGAPVFGPRKRILVPLDGSPTGEAALDFLRGRSTNGPIELLLMRVVSHIPVVIGADATFSVDALSPSELEAELQEAREYVARLGGSIADSSVVVRHQVIVAADAVARVILEAVSHEHADLIALGTHAKTGVSRLVLGSVSEEILESSPIPVLLVHPRRGSFADTPSNMPSTTGVGLGMQIASGRPASMALLTPPGSWVRSQPAAHPPTTL